MGQAGRFATTRWSVVVAAGDSQHPDYQRALADLCNDYWYPVYVFLRRRGEDPDRAQDTTQGFFSDLLEKDYIKQARQDRGRFRSFLLGALKFYLSNERQREHAQKRGGGQSPVSLDGETAERQYRLEPVEEHTPETLFERRWALVLLEQALDRLRDEVQRSDHPERASLVACLTGDQSAGRYSELAAELGMSESNVKVTVHRLRHRFGKVLRAEVAHTVSDRDKIEDELRHLFAVLESA